MNGRSDTFRGSPDSAEKVFELAKQGEINLVLQAHIKAINGNGKVETIEVVDRNNEAFVIEADDLIPLFGLAPKLGPIAEWGLNVDKSAIMVNTLVSCQIEIVG